MMLEGKYVNKSVPRRVRGLDLEVSPRTTAFSFAVNPVSLVFFPFVFPIVLFTFLCQGNAACRPPARRRRRHLSAAAPDGCSGPASQNRLGFPFRTACERHDFGYRNFAKQGRMTDTIVNGDEVEIRW